MLKRTLREPVEFLRSLPDRALAASLAYLFSPSAVLVGSLYFCAIEVAQASVGRTDQGRNKAPEAELSEATSLLLDQAEQELASNTADAWLDRMTLPQAVFAALDAFLAALGAPQSPDAVAEHRRRRRAWLRHAMDNWHRSPDYRDDAGYPMAPLCEGRRASLRRVCDALADPEGDEEVARDLAEANRREWLMAVARRPGNSPNSYDLPPPPVRTALDDYFAERANPLGLPVYPELHLISETVLRASIASYCPEYPHHLQWPEGLPAPVKAALDALC